MSIRQQLHFRLQSQVLASWLEKQPAESWWSVDGDPFLTGRLHFPCPSDELAAELRRISKPLLVLAANQNFGANRRELAESDLNQVSRVDQLPERALQLCWEDADPEIDWVLYEDLEVGKRVVASMGA